MAIFIRYSAPPADTVKAVFCCDLPKDRFRKRRIHYDKILSPGDVIRGIHAEDWNKLVTVTNGLCFCALVDLRKDSATFGKHETLALGTTDQALRGSIFISRGIGNSFCVVAGPVDYVYAVDAIWAGRDTSKDVAINLFDPQVNIEWPIPKEQMIISDRDLQSVNLSDL